MIADQYAPSFNLCEDFERSQGCGSASPLSLFSSSSLLLGYVLLSSVILKIAESETAQSEEKDHYISNLLKLTQV